MSRNTHLNVAKKRRNDEFYTQKETVEKELSHYAGELRGKIVYCNCDDYRVSQFYKYFKNDFNAIGLKGLISSNYSEDGDSYLAKFDGTRESITRLAGTGDYTGASDSEVSQALGEADVIVTNPPFSLFKEFIPFIVGMRKDLIILGTINAVTYVDIFPLIRDGGLFPGINFNVSEEFIVPNEYEDIIRTKRTDEGWLVVKIPNVAWYTTFHKKTGNVTKTSITYDPKIHPNYDNYDAVEVGKVSKLPSDYGGVMGVPVNFLSTYDPNEFVIVGSNRGRGQCPDNYYGRSSFLNGKETYKRIFIERRRSSSNRT